MSHEDTPVPEDHSVSSHDEDILKDTTVPSEPPKEKQSDPLEPLDTKKVEPETASHKDQELDIDLDYNEDTPTDEETSGLFDDDHDVGIFIPVFGFEKEVLLTCLERRIDYFNSESAFELESSKNGSYDNILARMCTETPEILSRATRIGLAKKNDRKLSSSYVNKEGRKTIGLAKPKFKELGEGITKVTGIDALIALQDTSKKGSTLRVPLLNSGFCIDLISPSLSSLRNYVDSAYSNVQSIGRSYGAFFFTYIDYFLKHAAMKLWRSHVVGSTLKSWDRGDNLVKSVRVEDYDTILMALASMMYPDGYDAAQYSCINPDKNCDHIVSGTIDLRECIIHSFEKLSPDAISHMQRAMKLEVTQAQIAEYQKLVPFIDGGLDGEDNHITWGRFTVVMKSPSWYDYNECGDRFIREVSSNLTDNDPTTVQQAIKSRALKQFTPWVSKVYLKLGEGKTAEIDLPEDVELALDRIQVEDEDNIVINAILDAIHDHKLTHIGVPTWDCPKCGHSPKTRTGYFIIDPLDTFFLICMSKLSNRG
jgi:hypothetical protein